MLCPSVKNRPVQLGKMGAIEVGRSERASSDRRQMEQLYERDEVGVLRPKPDPRKCPVVSAAVAPVLRKEERMVNAVSMPERDAVLVVLQDTLEDADCSRAAS